MSDTGRGSDGIIAKISDWLGNRKAKSLADERLKKLAQNPNLEQQEYAAAYKAMVGDVGGNVNCDDGVQSCPLLGKAARRKERLDIIAKSGNVAVTLPESERIPIDEAAKRLRQDMDEVEYGRAAKHVYLKYADPSQMPRN